MRRERYQEYIQQLLLERVRVASLVALGVLGVGFLADLPSSDSPAGAVVLIRATLAVLIGAVLAVSYLPIAARWGRPLSVLIVLLGALWAELLVLQTGNARSPHYAALILVLLGAPLIFPWGLRATLAAGVLIVVLYAAPLLLTAEALGVESLGAPLYFLAGATAIASTGSLLGDRQRRGEFDARVALEESTTELRRIGQNLVESVRQLETADKSKSRFFANASHELRTPLAVILAALELLQERVWSELPAFAQAQLRAVKANASQLLEMLNDLLDLARVDTGVVTLSKRSFELKSFLKAVVSQHQPIAVRKNIHLELTGEPRVLLSADMEKLEVIVRNILSNALKFTPEGGEISMRTRTEGEQVVIEVQDSGVGISAKQLPHVFERFATSGSLDSEVRGTGIGLALVKELVTLHGGTVEAQSRQGQGTTFRVRLPRGDVSAATGQERTPTQPTPLFLEPSVAPGVSLEPSEGHLRVLVVEDNAELRGYLVAWLSRVYRVLETGNGDEALALAKKELPDALICDVMLPGKSGYEIVQALKEDPSTSAIPVVLLTAQRGIEPRLEGFRYGADDFLSKPVNAQELLARVRAQLRIRELSAKLFHAQRMALVGTFTAGLAHEVRNPLNTIINGLPPVREALLGSAHTSPQSASSLIGVVIDAAHRLERVMRDLLEASHAGTEILRPWSPTRGVELTLRLLDRRLEGVTVHQELGFTGKVEGRPERLDQVVMNLIDNAARAAGPGGQIWVKSQAHQDGLLLTVEDSGAGIPPEVRGRVFDPFFTTRPVGEGTGLGLHLSKEIVSAHGGSLQAANAEHGGARFSMWLPQRHQQGET